MGYDFYFMHSQSCLCVSHLLYNLTFHTFVVSALLCKNPYFERAYVHIQHGGQAVLNFIRRTLNDVVISGIRSIC